MKHILEMNRIILQCKRFFVEGDLKITFNEALVLEGILSTDGKISEISRFLSKDRAYVYRLLVSLTSKEMIHTNGKSYLVTPKGMIFLDRAAQMCRHILEK